MANPLFQTVTDLPQSTQAEITRITAIASALRKTFEANFLTNYNDYIKNEIISKSSNGTYLITRGETIPQGFQGFSTGAIFLKRNAGLGINSIWVNVGDITLSNFIQTTSILPITIPSASILTLKDTPVAIVPAPGTGKKTIVDEILLLNTFGTVAYTGANNIEARYTDGAGAKVTADFDHTAFVDIASGTAYAVNKAVATSVVPVDNAAIVLAVPTANPGAGDGVITGFVRYHTVTL